MWRLWCSLNFGTTPKTFRKHLRTTRITRATHCPFLNGHMAICRIASSHALINVHSKKVHGQVLFTLLYGNKDLWGPWVPQWESCFDFQAQPHGFRDIWHTPSSSCDTREQLPWNQHKANDYRSSYNATKPWINKITSNTRKPEMNGLKAKSISQATITTQIQPTLIFRQCKTTDESVRMDTTSA